MLAGLRTDQRDGCSHQADGVGSLYQHQLSYDADNGMVRPTICPPHKIVNVCIQVRRTESHDKLATDEWDTLLAFNSSATFSQ